jgi:hypothetical protein
MRDKENGTVVVAGTNSVAFLAQDDNNTLVNTGTFSASGTDRVTLGGCDETV